MITAKISAGSSSIVQDIINMCQALKSPIGEWQGFVYNSTTGSKPWCVWAQRMDEDAHELQYVSSSGLASPPDGYEKITVSCPTTTGFALSFTQVNAMPNVMQTRDGGASQSVNANGVPTINIRMSAKPSSNVTDMVAVLNAQTAASGFWKKFFYNSATGSQPWQALAIGHDFMQNAIPAGGTVGVFPPVCIIIVQMGGMASPPAGSEALAIACPSSALTSNGFTQVAGPMSIG